MAREHGQPCDQCWGCLGEQDARWFWPASANKRVSDSERKEIAEYLYGECEWTMERIAKALDVSIPRSVVAVLPCGR